MMPLTTSYAELDEAIGILERSLAEEFVWRAVRNPELLQA
jgi:hypothetical protein